jgi:glycosyltransferase involved in cell wall biosynthesis
MVHRSLGVGGAEKIMTFLANKMSSVYTVELLLLEDKDITLKLEPEISLVQKDCYSDKPIIGKDMLSGLSDLRRMTDTIKCEIKEFRPDLVICFDLRILFALYMGRSQDIKILFSERADPNANPLYWKKLLCHIYKKIDYIVFQTKQAQEFYGKKICKKSCIIPNPAVERNFETGCIVKTEREPYIFAAGRMQYRKGFDILVKAFIKINQQISNYKLVIYGEGDQKPALVELINESGLHERIIIKSPENNVVSNNDQAALFVLPSRSEGIPNILIEAMMEEIPCVACDCSPGGARLLSDNGRYCLLAENDNVDSLAEKIVYALTHERELEDMAVLAHKSMDRFTPDVIMARWLEVIECLLQQEAENGELKNG